MRKIHNLDDKQRIRLLKIMLGISASYHLVTAFAVVAAYKSYEKGRSESIQHTMHRIFDVLEPTEDQLQEIKTVLEFDHGIDQLQDFLKRQK